MIEVTAGSKYMDIDAYAGCIAYAKLLNSLGQNAIATITADNFNKSITPSFFKMNYKIKRTLDTTSKFIILDVSNPQIIVDSVLEKEILEVVDHHPYYEFVDYWNKRNTKLILEDIGSVCTIVFEKIISNNKIEILDKDLCKLLIAGILDNTLNLKASITTKRDIDAYNQLMSIGNIEEDFAYNYFKECQNSYENDLLNSIEDDLKTNVNFPYVPETVGQLLVVDLLSILKRKKEIINYMNKQHEKWMINFINLEDGKSYILTSSLETSKDINKFLNGQIQDKEMVILEKFKLRKEIFKLALNYKHKKTI